MTTLEAVLWDVDGTLAETERDGHRVAFNMAFEAAGFDWRWSEERYGELLRIAGGRERLLADLESHEDAPADRGAREELAARVHREKNRYYAQLVGERRLALRSGVRELMEDCARSGTPMGITTTTSRSNLDALLRVQLGDDWRERFASVVVGEDVKRKKPDPEVFRIALDELGIAPGAALAIEDSPAGVEAARAAGVPVIVTRSRYFESETMFGALAIGSGLDRAEGWQPPARAGARIDLETLRAWHGSATSEA